MIWCIDTSSQFTQNVYDSHNKIDFSENSNRKTVPCKFENFSSSTESRYKKNSLFLFLPLSLPLLVILISLRSWRFICFSCGANILCSSPLTGNILSPHRFNLKKSIDDILFWVSLILFNSDINEPPLGTLFARPFLTGFDPVVTACGSKRESTF